MTHQIVFDILDKLKEAELYLTFKNERNVKIFFMMTYS